MIKNIFKWIALFILMFVLQTTLIPSLAIVGVKPDLIVLILFMLAIKVGVLPAIYVGFLVGLAQDLYSPAILGQSALAKTFAGFFAGLFNEKVMRLDPVVLVIILVLTFFVNDIVFYLVQILKNNGDASIIISELVTATLPRALYTLLFAIVPILWEQFAIARVRR